MVWQIPIIGHLREHGQDFPSDLRNLSDFHLIPLHHMFKIYGHYDIILQLKNKPQNHKILVKMLQNLQINSHYCLSIVRIICLFSVDR